MLAVVVFVKQKDYLFINTIKDPQAIAEHALKELGISYESLEDATRISDYENTFLLYLRPKKESISFREVKAKTLRKQIIEEIQHGMVVYKKPSKAFGFFFLALAMILAGSAILVLNN